MFNGINNIFNFNINTNIETENHGNENSVPINFSSLFHHVLNTGLKSYSTLFHQLLHRITNLSAKTKWPLPQEKLEHRFAIAFIKSIGLIICVIKIEKILLKMENLEKDFTELFTNQFENLSLSQLQYWQNILSLDLTKNVPKALFDHYTAFISSNAHLTQRHNIRICMFDFYRNLKLEDKLAEAMTFYLKIIKISTEDDEIVSQEIKQKYMQNLLQDGCKLCISIGACPQKEMEKHQLAFTLQFLSQMNELDISFHSNFYDSSDLYDAIEEIYHTIELSTGILCSTESILSHFDQAMRKGCFSEALTLYAENQLRKHLVEEMGILFQEEIDYRCEVDENSIFFLCQQMKEMQKKNSKMNFKPLFQKSLHRLFLLSRQQLRSGYFHSSPDRMLLAEILTDFGKIIPWRAYHSPKMIEN